MVASFAFGGTELVGLAAAEAENPRKSIPQATKQVFWRITFFYVVSLFILGLIVPSDNENLLNATGSLSKSKYSPFIIAMNLASIKVLPSIFNAIITMAVISVANSCTYASTRTMQALAERGMAPGFLGYVDKKGRPIWGIVIQLCFGLLAFVGESGKQGIVFNWLLALSGLSNFFIWASINLCHIRFRHAWKVQGHVKAELPYEAVFGVAGSYYGFGMNIVCLIATFYVAVSVSNSVSDFTAANFKSQLEINCRQTCWHKTSSPIILPHLSSSLYTWDGSSIHAIGKCGSRPVRWTLHLTDVLWILTPRTCHHQRPGKMLQ